MNKKGGITGRGWTWEILNSWWIAFAFAGLSWIGFFIIGNKGKQKKWLHMGAIFFVLQFVTLFFTENKYGTYVISVWLIAYVSAIIVLFRQRKEYLLIRDILISAKVDEKERQRLRDSILKDFEQKGEIDISKMKGDETKAEDVFEKQVVSNMKDKDENQFKNDHNAVESESVMKDQKLMDINHCTEHDLTELPGISVVLAKKAMEYRKRNLRFHSVEEFYGVLELKPHFIAQLEKKITCQIDGSQSSEQTMDKNNAGGRKLDF